MCITLVHHVVEHDHVRARGDRLVRLRLGLHLYLEQEAEATDLARLLDRGCDRAWGTRRKAGAAEWRRGEKAGGAKWSRP